MKPLIIALLCSLLCVPTLSAQAEPHDGALRGDSISTAPQKNQKIRRLGYVEGGDYADYPLTLAAIVAGLQELSWLNLPHDPPVDLRGEELWQWLAQHAQSDYLEFVPDAYWRPGNFDSSQRAQLREQLHHRFTEQHDLDLLIAMGTWAGQDLRQLGPPIPVVVASTSDAVASGIVDSALDSGKDNLHARVEPERYQRQLSLFHQIVPFTSLGVVYEDSDEGRSYAAWEAVNEVSQALGFSVVPCHAPASNISTEQASQYALQCYQQLAEQDVEAVYITTHQGVHAGTIKQIADILSHAGIPSFSMAGAADVKQGILLSMAQASMSSLGRFHAEVIARILNGASPRSLTQIWVDPAKIALNLRTARQIGFDPPIDILLAADEVFR